VKVSLNGGILELTWGNNRHGSRKPHLKMDIPVYWLRHDAQYYAAISISESGLGGKFKPTLRSP
jgi:hypothetical protein